MLAPAVASLAALLALAAAPPPDEGWRPLLSYDEVAVDLARSTVQGTGPYTVQVRWTFRDRAASPAAWDGGVRYAIDVMELDCRTAASRTWSTTAFAANGDVVRDHSADEQAPAWGRHPAESVGGLLVREGCAALAARN
ncbi:hypothetical protein [Roseisolibacter sp. H3M3-2]|uniref:surface-adhesin E family protein n=1 Tax=Roseisolibacter sp. H3M3-2 TaxID=3031323 RepID=UPI0023DA2C27|nr:hypothetical protein [Roseisolibacter sp. H3M3-2]MDF1501356.1 hypothetical protein [Roseisolibacter sp. H3M3-2]